MHVRNAALACTDVFTFEVGDKQWQCRLDFDFFHGLAQEYAEIFKVWPCKLYLRMAGHYCVCYVENFEPFIMEPLMAEDFPFLPQELARIVVEGSAQKMLQSLSRMTGYSCECIEASLVPESADEEPQGSFDTEQGLMFSLQMLAPHAGKRARVFLTQMPPLLMEVCFRIFIERNAQSHSVSIPASLVHVRVPFPIVWHTAPLMQQDIAQLERGDCLLMPPTKECVPVHILSGHRVMQAQLNLSTGNIRLETFMQENSDNIPSTHDLTRTEHELLDADVTMPQEPGPPLIHPKDCPIPIQCHLGTVSLSLEAVTQLTTGMILGPLERMASCVTLSIGGSNIGRGTLVDIEGRVGVQVTEIFSKETLRS